MSATMDRLARRVGKKFSLDLQPKLQAFSPKAAGEAQVPPENPASMLDALIAQIGGTERFELHSPEGKQALIEHLGLIRGKVEDLHAEAMDFMANADVALQAVDYMAENSQGMQNVMRTFTSDLAKRMVGNPSKSMQAMHVIVTGWQAFASLNVSAAGTANEFAGRE